MHLSEKIYSLYYKLPDLHNIGWVGKAVDKVLGRLVKKVVLDPTLPVHFAETLTEYRLETSPLREHKIICSVTTFPARIQLVWIALESLFRQTVKPDKIILWLSADQFKDMALPETLIRLQQKGLDIRFCENDLKAHKKYLYALQHFPKDWVITFDDDLYHDPHSIENLLVLKSKFPDHIVTNRAHRITFEVDHRTISPYRRWKHNVGHVKPSRALVATGGCGTLYESRLLFKDFNNEQLIKDLCYHADDIWLKIMAHLNNTPVVTNQRYGKDPIAIGETQKVKLVSTNVLTGGNDKQLSDLMKYYNLQPISFRD